jgi:hypothetical protein
VGEIATGGPLCLNNGKSFPPLFSVDRGIERGTVYGVRKNRPHYTTLSFFKTICDSRQERLPELTACPALHYLKS